MTAFVLMTITGLSLAALYFLIASGLSLIFGLMDVLNFAHAVFFTVGGYVGWAVMAYLDIIGPLGLRFVVALVAASIAGLAVGWVVERVFIKPLYGDHVPQILVTVGIVLAGAALLGGWFGYDPRILTIPAWFRETIIISGARIPMSRIVSITVAVSAFVGLMLFIRHTRHGLIIRAGVENRAMVRALGIDVGRSFAVVFAVGGLLAALGGVLGAVFFHGIFPELGTVNLIFAFIVVVIGGLGSISGTAVASVLVGLTQQYVNFYGSPGYGDLAVVALLAIVLLIRPQGLLGTSVR
jgi:branched-chain amino acid transport system permease protein